ncbi:uncharacterized protein LOC143888318 [Tasmannia lanceolata]|uniref:uncharacterized protein LOC143888318 n=1 Tax=Tasmannia lanceolata TaxID=3420 RepID=UPI004063B54E
MCRHKDMPEISLRRFELSDTDDFMVWSTDDRVNQFCRWDTNTSREEVVTYLKKYVIPHPWFKAICLKNRAIGYISVCPGRGCDKCRGEIGYVLASKYWGQGIATKAVRIVISTIFREWPNLERVEALVDVQNPRSQRVLEKAGFAKEGVLRKYFIHKGKTRDMVMYSFLSTGPESRRKGIGNDVLDVITDQALEVMRAANSL